MRMALVKLALATGAGLVTLAACGSANDGYDPAVADGGRVRERQRPVRRTSVTCSRNCSRSGPRTSWAIPSAASRSQWYMVSGGGSVSTGTTTTDANGLAQVSWVLGPIVGVAEGAGGRVPDGIAGQLRRDGAQPGAGWRRRRRRARRLARD